MTAIAHLDEIDQGREDLFALVREERLDLGVRESTY
jgi:hypothetical protein